MSFLALSFSCSENTKNTSKKESLQENGPWTLTWSEEFNYEGLPDSSIWTMEEGFKRNHEEQYYLPNIKNAEVKDGYLTIRAIKEKVANAHFDKDSDNYRKNWETGKYSSASIFSKGKFEAQYGRFEVSAKLPYGKGVWPAIWLLGSKVKEEGWPRCGE